MPIARRIDERLCRAGHGASYLAMGRDAPGQIATAFGRKQLRKQTVLSTQ